MEQLKHLPIAKSNANRLLIMASLAGVLPQVSQIIIQRYNWEDCADDIHIMHRVLREIQAPLCDALPIVNVGAAGTVLRFVTALASVLTTKPLQITGTERLRNRPLLPLIEQLRLLGARIDGEWTPKNEHTPLTIYPPKKKLQGGILSEDFEAESSQYISALLMIAPYFSTSFGIPLLPQDRNSRPYIDLTLSMMREAGSQWFNTQEGVVVKPIPYSPEAIMAMAHDLEYDWSAASYAFGWCSVARRPIIIPHLKASDKQGDRAIVGLMRPLGVKTRFLEGGGLELMPLEVQRLACYTPEHLVETPDLIPTLVVTALMRGQPFVMKGIAGLRAKESNRIKQMVKTAALLGFHLHEEENRLSWNGVYHPIDPQKKILVDTAKDHRMAMAWSIASIYFPSMEYTDSSVVTKSYPGFWSESIYSILPH